MDVIELRLLKIVHGHGEQETAAIKLTYTYFFNLIHITVALSDAIRTVVYTIISANKIKIK